MEPRSAGAKLGYFPAVDGLRAVAILSVLVFHLRPGYLRGGFAGVAVFFVISGFVVTASLAHLRFSRGAAPLTAVPPGQPANVCKWHRRS